LAISTPLQAREEIMSKDRLERKSYRKSPGRQYGYEYNPLHTQSGTQSQSGRSLPATTGHQTVQLAPRPDPRRTRQLLRQSILASKAKNPLPSEESGIHDEHDISGEAHMNYDELEDSTLYVNRHGRDNSARRTHPLMPRPTRHLDRDTEEGMREELVDMDPTTDVDPQFNRHMSRPVRRSVATPTKPHSAVRRPEPSEEYNEEDDERERVRARRKAKRKRVTRRRLLASLGAVVVGGAAVGVAAYELPKVPQTLNNVGRNIEQELQNSFNQGFNAGAEAVRKEFITALENLEGVSLDAATAAAKLTRVAYDVFVSPLVKFLAGVATDFLDVTLRAFIQARHWLSNIGQDNSTLAGLQSVLESWVSQSQQLPKQVQAIADTDLDGAQAYLRALRRKIDEEQAKLNAQNATPTVTPKSKPTPTPKS
jgi:hypothetical protein